MKLRIWPFRKEGPKPAASVSQADEEAAREDAAQKARILLQAQSYSGVRPFWQVGTQEVQDVAPDEEVSAQDTRQEETPVLAPRGYKLVPPVQEERLPPQMEQLHLNRLRELDFQERQQQRQDGFADALYGRKNLGIERAAIYNQLGYKFLPIQTPSARAARWDAQGKAKIDAAREEFMRSNPNAEYDWAVKRAGNDALGGLPAGSTKEQADAYWDALQPDGEMIPLSDAELWFLSQAQNPAEQTPEKLQQQMEAARAKQAEYKQTNKPFCNAAAREYLAGEAGIAIGHLSGERNGPTANQYSNILPHIGKILPNTPDGAPDFRTGTELVKHGKVAFVIWENEAGGPGHIVQQLGENGAMEIRYNKNREPIAEYPYVKGYLGGISNPETLIRDITDKYPLNYHLGAEKRKNAIIVVFDPKEQSPV